MTASKKKISSTVSTPKRRGIAITHKRQKEAKKIFLRALAEIPNIRAACNAAHIDRTTAYNYKKTDAAFAAAWEQALKDSIDVMEIEAHRRAVHGVDKPVYYKDQRIDILKEYSDTLMIFLLKAHRPKKYRERVEHTHTYVIKQALQQMQQLGISLDDIRKHDPALAGYLTQIGVA